ncbi:hypothetical protein HDU78_007038 [Chytriomyces hyalinus]|nr:hypothetical protein HDU78_007038 [Chytriomyces hyalinus]
MPKVEIIPSNNEHDGFMSGHPGLGPVTIRGVVRLSHKNKTAIKKVPFVAIRLRGATFTKVRPESEKGLNGPKFKGRWDCHSALPPMVLYGAGSAASSGSEPLLLHPNEVCDLPFEFRISKHEALRNFPSSVVLPQVGNLRSRGESRHWLECTINWYRKGGLVLAERRVAIEIWIHNITPKTLSGMLLSRTPSTSGFSLAGSMASMSIRSNQSDKDRLAGPPPTDPAREKSPQMPTTDTPWDQVALHSRMSSSSLYRISHGRRGSVMTPLPTLGIKWAGEDYSAGVNRRVFTGGERLKLTFQITAPFQGARRPMGGVDEERKGAAEMEQQDPTKHHQVITPNAIENNSPRASGEEVGKLKDAAESSNPFGRKATIFPGFSKIISNLRKKKRQASIGPPGAVDTASHLCNLKIYIEETQTVRAPLEAGDVARVNEAHQIHVDSFVGNSLSPASAAALPERRSFHLETAEPNEFHIIERHPHFENPADFVRTATGTKKFLCLVHSETFEGEFGAEQVVEFDLPPIFGAKDLDVIASDDYEESIQDTPSIRDEADFSSLPRAALAMIPSRGASALSMDRGSKRSYNPSIATTASERQSVIGAKSLKQKRLEKTGRSASRLTQKANLTIKHNDLRRLNSESDQTHVAAIRPTCDHPAISISHELVLELEIPNHGDASESHREIRSGVPASGPLPLAQEDGNQSHDSLQGNRSLNKRLTSMTRSMFQNLIPHRASSTSETDPTRFHRLKLLSSNSFKSSSDTLRESTASPMTPTPEVYLEAEEEFSVEPLAKGPPHAAPPAVLPDQLLAMPSAVVSAEHGPNGTRKIELRSPVTVSPLNVSECRAIVLETPSATGADLFGVPLGVLEDEFPGGNPDMSRRGSAAAVSVKSRESQISWLNLE